MNNFSRNVREAINTLEALNNLVVEIENEHARLSCDRRKARDYGVGEFDIEKQAQLKLLEHLMHIIESE